MSEFKIYIYMHTYIWKNMYAYEWEKIYEGTLREKKDRWSLKSGVAISAMIMCADFSLKALSRFHTRCLELKQESAALPSWGPGGQS